MGEINSGAVSGKLTQLKKLKQAYLQQMFPQEGEDVPRVRFAGFTEPWVQRKLEDVSEIVAGGDIDKEKIREAGRYPVLANALTNDGIVGYYDTEYRIEAPAVTVTGRGDVGHAQARKLNFTPVVRLLSVKSSHDVDFLENAINTKKTIAESTGVPQLTIPQLEKYEVWLPVPEEQTAIGNFFRTLDDTIAIYERKLDRLKKLKNGYLQQMFPQDGEDVPRVRFAGFTELWVQRKLGEVVERVQGNDGRMDLPTLTISAGSGWLDQRERFSNNIAGKEQENYTLLSNGELSYNKGNSKLAKYGVVFELKTHEEALVPRVYHSFKPTCESNSSFLEYMFATKIPDTELAKLITSGARMDGLLNIGYESFIGIKILIPAKAEQTAIGNFFRYLDELISLHK